MVFHRTAAIFYLYTVYISGVMQSIAKVVASSTRKDIKVFHSRL